MRPGSALLEGDVSIGTFSNVTWKEAVVYAREVSIRKVNHCPLCFICPQRVMQGAEIIITDQNKIFSIHFDQPTALN